MKNKRASKLTFFVVLLLILALAYTTFFGIENWHGDTREVYVKSANDIEWGIDISGGVEAVFVPDVPAGTSISDEQIEAAKTILDVRLVGQKITDYEIFADTANDQIIVRFPMKTEEGEIKDAVTAVQNLGKKAELSFHKGETKTETPLFTGVNVASANAVYDNEQRQHVVSLTLDETATSIFASTTEELAKTKGKIAIYMDDVLLTAPVVENAIPNGSAVITGNFTAESAAELANQINSGALPFGLTAGAITATDGGNGAANAENGGKISVISATLGTNALKVMVIAGAIAFGVICILMILRYRLIGVVACIALLGQLSGSIAAISGYFPGTESFTLTIPGIAGIILSIGVGVDCNVIAAERIRQEFKLGRTIDGAINNGFKNSLSAIVDGNVTIIIVSVVLMGAFGTSGIIFYPLFSWIFGASIAGSVYSFGYTLLVGVIFNFIMGVLCSKWMLKSISQFKCLRKPWLYGGKNNG